VRDSERGDAELKILSTFLMTAYLVLFSNFFLIKMDPKNSKSEMFSVCSGDSSDDLLM
jgi:hypothetical protein